MEGSFNDMKIVDEELEKMIQNTEKLIVKKDEVAHKKYNEIRLEAIKYVKSTLIKSRELSFHDKVEFNTYRKYDKLSHEKFLDKWILNQISIQINDFYTGYCSDETRIFIKNVKFTINNLFEKIKKKGENILKDYCENCSDETEYTIKKHEVSELVRNKEIKYMKKEAYCNKCASRMYIAKINDENLNTMYSIIREKENLIKIEEIKEIIDKYSITDVSLACILGYKESTIIHYLQGDIPTKQHSDMLKSILNNPELLENLLEKNKHTINDRDYSKCKQKLQSLKS